MDNNFNTTIMTTLEQIRKAKTIIENGTRIANKEQLIRETGISWNFANAMIQLGILKIEDGLFHWNYRNPTENTYVRIRQRAKQDRVNRSNNPVEQTLFTQEPVNVDEPVKANINGILVIVRDGRAVIERNGARLEVDNLETLENILKIIK